MTECRNCKVEIEELLDNSEVANDLSWDRQFCSMGCRTIIRKAFDRDYHLGKHF